MEYIIATYRSRNKAIEVFGKIVESGYRCMLVSTPQAANVGCGLSLRISPQDFDRLRGVLSKVVSFSGFFRVTNVNGRTILTSI